MTTNRISKSATCAFSSSATRFSGGKTEINLTGKEFNLLLFLARHPNQVFSKKYLFEMIWHLDALGELATVTVHVNRLRDKLNEVEPEFTAIETVWGNGYRFRVEE